MNLQEIRKWLEGGVYFDMDREHPVLVDWQSMESVELAGDNSPIGVDTEGFWGAAGVYTDIAAAGTQLNVVTSNANDIAGGTGCQLVRIYYANTVNEVLHEDVATAGVGSTGTVATDIMRLLDVYGAAFGSLGCCSSNAVVSFGGTTYAAIVAGSRARKAARYFVPKGKTALVLGWGATLLTAQAGELSLATDWDPITASHLTHTKPRSWIDATTVGWIPRDLPMPLIAPEFSRVEILGRQLGGAATAASVTADLLVFDNA